MVAAAVKDPKNGKIVTAQKEIKKVVLEYCKTNLKEKYTEPGFELEKDVREMLHNKRMKEIQGEGFEVTKALFNKVADKVEKSGKRNYDFFVKTGKKHKTAIFQVTKRMVRDENFPGSFNKTTLHMLFKGGRGKRKEDLKANRFIHSRLWFPRVVEGVVVEQMKPTILRGSSMYQVGGQSGHRPQELLFVIRSIIAKYLKNKNMIVLDFYDISSFFDQEQLLDGMNTLHRLGVDPHAWKCWYLLNKDTTIQVVCGAGVTDTAEVGECIGQGTKGGALVSQANLDIGVRDQFRGSEDEAKYGNVECGPVVFQDDLARASGSVASSRAGSIRMNMVMNQKGLRLNQEKTGFLIYGSKKQIEEVRREVEKRPITCGSFEVTEKEQEKWLGDYFVGGTNLGDSVLVTIQERMGKCKAACMEIITIIQDLRSQVVGGFTAGIKLFEACVVPGLLYNSGTWTEISKEAVNKLEDFLLWFIRMLFQTGPGALKVGLRAETGMLSMELRIWREKLTLALHLSHLPQETFAKQVWDQQVLHGWPGLAIEVKEICQELRVESVTDWDQSAQAYRAVVTEACRQKDEAYLKRGMEGKTKAKTIIKEGCNIHDYTKNKCVRDVRDKYAERNFQLPFAGNYLHDKRFLNTEWLCLACDGEERDGEMRKVIEEQEHIASRCPGYEDLRQHYDIQTDEGLVEFYRAVIKRRDDSNDNDWNIYLCMVVTFH